MQKNPFYKKRGELIKSAKFVTLGLLLLAAIVEMVVDQKSAHQIIAEAYIGECQSISLSGIEAFQASDQWAIFFKSVGFQGPVETMIIISGDEIEKLVVLKSNEGLDRSALSDSVFRTSFEQNIQELPLGVDAITGATISSQIVIDDIHRVIKEWNERND